MDKEYYIKQVEKVAEYLKSRADILFLDIRGPISNVNINIDIKELEEIINNIINDFEVNLKTKKR